LTCRIRRTSSRDLQLYRVFRFHIRSPGQIHDSPVQIHAQYKFTPRDSRHYCTLFATAVNFHDTRATRGATFARLRMEAQLYSLRASATRLTGKHWAAPYASSLHPRSRARARPLTSSSQQHTDASHTGAWLPRVPPPIPPSRPLCFPSAGRISGCSACDAASFEGAAVAATNVRVFITCPLAPSLVTPRCNRSSKTTDTRSPPHAPPQGLCPSASPALRPCPGVRGNPAQARRGAAERRPTSRRRRRHRRRVEAVNASPPPY